MDKKRFPWKIVIAAMLIQGGALGVIANTLGILFSAVINDLGFRAGDLSLYYLIRSVVSAAVITYTTRLYFSGHHRLVLGVLGTIYSVSISAMGFFSHLWQWYFAAVLSGIGMSCMIVVLTIVLNNWFASNNGTVIGITLSSSGVAGAVFSPVFSKCITLFGWRITALIMGVIAFGMIVLPGVFMLTPSPGLEGKLPYGEKAEETGSTETRNIVPGYVFLLCILAIGGTSSLAQFNQQLPTFAQSLGYSLAVGAALTSCSMIGNLSGKVILGFMIDRLGVFKAAIILTGVIGGSFLLFLIGSGSPLLLYIAGVCYGTCYGIGGLLLSILLLNIYGSGLYREKVSRLTAINTFIAAFSGSAAPYVYDLFGTWSPVLIAAFCLCAAAAAIYIWLSRRHFEQEPAGA